MTAVRMRFLDELRAHWRSWLALVVVAGLAGALALALAAAANRTQTALGRFETAVHGANAYVDPGFGFGEEKLDLARVARLPQVVAAEPTAHLVIISRSTSGAAVYPGGAHSVEYLAPMDGRPRDAIDAPKLLRGRLPDPRTPDEALGDSRALKFLGVHVGDTLKLRLVSHDALWNHGNDIRLGADPLTANWGEPLVKVRVVGESANARTDVDGGQFHLSPAFYPAHGGRGLGSWINELPVRLRHGKRDVPAFKAEVDRIAGDLAYGFFDPSLGRPQVQRSMTLQAEALGILAVCWAIAAVMLVGQALFRHTATLAPVQETLRALGMTRRQLVGVGAARSATIALPAAAIAVGVAFALSPLSPIGRAREIEPHPGFSFNLMPLAAGGAGVFVAVLAAGVLAGWRVASSADRAAAGSDAGRLGSLEPALRRAGLPPSGVAGVRMALQRGARTSPIPVRATLVAAILAVGVAGAALTFASSVQHLLQTPRLYGQNWDFEGGPPYDSTGFMRTVRADRAIAGMAVGAGAFNPPVLINGREVGVRAMDDVIGTVTPTVIHGRAPTTDSEVLLGTKTMHALHVRIGDPVTMRDGRHSASLLVVGSGVLPAGKAIKLGEGAAMTFKGLKRVQLQAQADLSEVRLAPGADRGAELAKLTRLFDGSVAVRPQALTDFGGVNGMPFIIVGLFGGVAAATLAHTLVISTRRRRRELAILKTLGFTRGQVAATVAWQASTVAAIGVLVGLPLGVAVGRFVYNVFAHDLGVVSVVVVPVSATLLLIPAAVLLANLVAAFPGWSAARTRPALVLRAE